MKFSVPTKALIAVVDGANAHFYSNVAPTGITLEKRGEYLPNSQDHRAASSLPSETSPREKSEANFANHIADELYRRVQQGNVEALVLIADPQTLGQIRPALHQEVTKRITGELPKTLTKASIGDIEKALNTAAGNGGT